MQKIKISVAGAGWISTNRHLPIITKNSHFELFGIMDRHAERAERAARKFGISRYKQSTSLLECDWIKEADVVSILTSPMSHFQLCQEALNLGKHVILEKPFAMSISEGEQLVQLAKAKNLKIAIVHNFQFSRSVHLLRKDLNEGILGNIKSLEIYQMSNPERLKRKNGPQWIQELPFGVFYDESPHFFYLVSSFLSKPLQIINSSYYGSTLSLKTPARITLQGKGEILGSTQIPVLMNLNFEAALSEWFLLISGDRHIGIMDIFRDIYIRLPNDRFHLLPNILQSSGLATWQHWSQHFFTGWKVLTHSLFYGCDEIYKLFAENWQKPGEIPKVGTTQAIEVLKNQHCVLNDSIQIQ